MTPVPARPDPPDDAELMRLAIAQAVLALGHDDVPIGAVVVHEGRVVGAGHNERELRQDPTAHAEVIALRAAAAALGSWRVLESTLYVTLEPCAMCAGAIVLARVPRVVYGCTDPKAGAAGSVLDVLAEPRLNHRPEVVGGVLAGPCAALLTEFFGARRRGAGGLVPQSSVDEHADR
ncbi:MAG: tRNA(adenine34) deaminase [Solirubrobacteraceae bacterium]|nr:tRNA(adenine34) deaminase [Solirubrobacteraceae bacterium]